MPNVCYQPDEMWLQYKAEPTDELRNRLVERYLPLVRYNAERIKARLPKEVELDDLISAGVFGLFEAIEAFDLDRGVRFETYCAPRIRGAILDELRRMDWVPRLVRRQEKKSEVVVPAVFSLTKKWYETDSHKDVCGDVLVDDRAEDPIHRQQCKDLMKIMLKGLNRQERIIMILYHWEDLTMREIGLTLDLSESRISQMHTDVIKRLRDQLAEKRAAGELVVA